MDLRKQRKTAVDNEPQSIIFIVNGEGVEWFSIEWITFVDCSCLWV